MPNLPSLYTQLTSNDGAQTENKKSPEQPEELDAGRQQVMFNWRQSTVTQDMMKHFADECTTLLQEAVDLAVNNRNPERIIHNLIRVDTLRKVLTYGA